MKEKQDLSTEEYKSALRHICNSKEGKFVVEIWKNFLIQQESVVKGQPFEIACRVEGGKDIYRTFLKILGVINE